eukprot:scaffold4463_cov60-Phaeocystis_antarctica.AAC.2
MLGHEGVRRSSPPANPVEASTPRPRARLATGCERAPTRRGRVLGSVDRQSPTSRRSRAARLAGRSLPPAAGPGSPRPLDSHPRR